MTTPPSSAVILTGTIATTPVLAATDLTCGYAERAVVEHVNLTVCAGEMVAVLGRNGSGKSTLLRSLAGALTPLSGTVHLHGAPIQSVRRRDVAQTLAVVPQELSVPFAFSLREVVELGRSPYLHFLGGLGARDREIVDKALAATDLSTLEDRLFQHVSGGERQRTAIAMALAQEPEILLLDEPTVHLDIAHQMEILTLLRHLCREKGMGIVTAMHDINLTYLFADRVLILGEGKVLADGTPREVLSPAVIERAFETRVVLGTHPTLDVPQVSLVP